MNILITGGTGFLGSHLIDELKKQSHKIFILTRQSTNSKINDAFIYIKGDVTHPEVIEDSEVRKDILSKIDLIIHAAALYDLNASHSDSFLQNVVGTQNMIRFAKKAQDLKSFYYISTIAVADEESFYLYEDVLPKRNNFSDYYSETKYLAEELVRSNFDDFPVTIIRPGVIIGHSVTGDMNKIDGPYYFIEAVKNNLKILKNLPLIPLSYNPRTLMPIIPVDHCAIMISLLCSRDSFKKEIKTYHLISEELPNIKQFLEDLKNRYNYGCEFLPVGKNLLNKVLLKNFKIPEQIIPFMFSKITYDKSRTSLDLPELKNSRYSDYKIAFLK